MAMAMGAFAFGFVAGVAAPRVLGVWRLALLDQIGRGLGFLGFGLGLLLGAWGIMDHGSWAWVGSKLEAEAPFMLLLLEQPGGVWKTRLPPHLVNIGRDVIPLVFGVEGDWGSTEVAGVPCGVWSWVGSRLTGALGPSGRGGASGCLSAPRDASRLTDITSLDARSTCSKGVGLEIVVGD
jgi:hypothetical protein